MDHHIILLLSGFGSWHAKSSQVWQATLELPTLRLIQANRPYLHCLDDCTHSLEVCYFLLWRTRWPLFPSFFILPLLHLAKTEGDMSKWAVLSVCQSHLHKYLHLLLLFIHGPCRSPCSPLVFGEYPLSFRLRPILVIWEMMAFLLPFMTYL